MHYSTYFVTRERQNAQKLNRKMEKKVKECSLIVDDEKRHAEQYKDQVRSDHNDDYNFHVILQYLLLLLLLLLLPLRIC